MAQPTSQQLAEIDSRLDTLIQAITSHPLWAGESNQALYHLWDFVSRSKYLLSEYDNIKAGRGVEHPEQFKRGAGSGNAKALEIFQDVCARTMMVQMMVEGGGGPISGGQSMDYGQGVKDAVRGLKEACAEQAVMAGMMLD
ncbi:hypothetical protein DL98DRAFT_649374 [Cadophora sp. DSE1049]|nr:hypothetical protein DL98DRAFT_649374 [Cadophora sp. DSE1049]